MARGALFGLVSCEHLVNFMLTDEVQLPDGSSSDVGFKLWPDCGFNTVRVIFLTILDINLGNVGSFIQEIGFQEI